MARLRRPSRAQGSAESSGSKLTRSLRNRQSTPMRASRQRMREDSSDDNDELANPRSPEDVDGDSGALSDDDFEEPTVQSSSARPRKARRSRPAQVTPKKTRAKPSPRKKQPPKWTGGQPLKARTSKRRASRSGTEPGSPTKKSKRSKTEAQLSVREGRIPPWTDTRIPYDAWVSIFSYASICASNGWLVDCATVCKIFLEPALTALYAHPVPSTTPKLKRLAELLKKKPSETIINYRNKIKSLSLDIKDTPAAQYFPLIHPLPRLKDLFIVTTLDQPPYRDLETKLRWSYLDSIFQALRSGSKAEIAESSREQDASPGATDGAFTAEPQATGSAADEDFVTLEEKPFPTSLSSWEWSGRMLGGAVPNLQDLARLHKEPFFQNLTALSFTNFQTPTMLRLANSSVVPQPVAELGDIEAAHAIADAIHQLNSLRHLVFEASTIVDHVLLPLLPTALTHLTLINCWEVRSDVFATFLQTHGGNLVSLNLSHCQSLNLEFLTSLGAACPNLKELSMDLSYYSLHNSINDSDPMYDYVLLPDQIPHWPSTLQFLSLDNIKDCSAETAKMFLTSLLDNAERLNDLRHIYIKMMLNIPWQERAKMRTEWRQKMEDVFLRVSPPPTDWRTVDAPAGTEDEPASRKRKPSRRASPARRSSRLSTESRISRNASTALRHQEVRLNYRDPDTDHDELSQTGEDEDGSAASSSASGSENESTRSEQFIQGMCTTVNILFDNQKPMELQYGMEDFRDSETDSEEEWNGDDDDGEDETVFVWR